MIKSHFSSTTWCRLFSSQMTLRRARVIPKQGETSLATRSMSMSRSSSVLKMPLRSQEWSSISTTSSLFLPSPLLRTLARRSEMLTIYFSRLGSLSFSSSLLKGLLNQLWSSKQVLEPSDPSHIFSDWDWKNSISQTRVHTLSIVIWFFLLFHSLIYHTHFPVTLFYLFSLNNLSKISIFFFNT